MAGLWVGQACGVLLLPGFGVSSSSPGFLGTQPPYAMQALIILDITKTKCNSCFIVH